MTPTEILTESIKFSQQVFDLLPGSCRNFGIKFTGEKEASARRIILQVSYKNSKQEWKDMQWMLLANSTPSYITSEIEMFFNKLKQEMQKA